MDGRSRETEYKKMTTKNKIIRDIANKRKNNLKDFFKNLIKKCVSGK